MKKRVVAIIQAHMSSTRLPGKVLRDIMGKPSLYRMIERIRYAELIDDIVIATSTKECDDVLEQFCRENGLLCFRGSDSDVLARFHGAAKQYPADAYVRLTSDNPLLCPTQIDSVVRTFLENTHRYVRTHPTMCPNGQDAEIFEASLLEEAYQNATEGYEHEHVTPYMYWKQPSVHNIVPQNDIGGYRCTMDTPEDFEMICHVFRALYPSNPKFTYQDIIAFLDDHPEIRAINKHIKQKPTKG